MTDVLVEDEDMIGTLTDEIVWENPSKTRNIHMIAALTSIGLNIIDNISIWPMTSSNYSCWFWCFCNVKSTESKKTHFLNKVNEINADSSFLLKKYSVKTRNKNFIN